MNFSDWQSDDDIDDESACKAAKKTSPDAAFKVYYDRLKASIKEVGATVSESLAMELPTDKILLLDYVQSMAKEVESYKRLGWHHFGGLGHALASLKRLYFTVCFLCKPQNLTMHEILSCKRCVKASNGNTFFEDVSKKVDYDKGHINFLITVAGLAAKFPKVKQTPYNSAELKKYMIYLPEQMLKDKHLWI